MTFELNLKRFPIETVSFTYGTGHPHVGKKVHFQFGGTIPLARGAASAINIETESTRRITPLFRQRQLREQFPNVIKHFDVGPRIRAGRPSNG